MLEHAGKVCFLQKGFEGRELSPTVGAGFVRETLAYATAPSNTQKHN